MPNLETVGRLQELQLEIIAYTNFNNLDGVKIKELLLDNRQLWRAALLIGNEFLLLRELENDHSMADTLYILGNDGFESQLEELVNTNFEASEIEWIRDETALVLLGYHKNNSEQKIPPVLSVWWD